MTPRPRRPRRFVLLDRDGTIIVERNYLRNPLGVELLPGAAAGLARLRELGLGLIVVTNQSGLSRGYFTTATLAAIHKRMGELLAAQGASIDGIYFCPHVDEDHCDCRKPAVGLVRRAAADWGFISAECFVIGDKTCDLDLGRNLGATTFLVRTGYGAQLEAEKTSGGASGGGGGASATISRPNGGNPGAADYVVDDLPAAAAVIEDLLRA